MYPFPNLSLEDVIYLFSHLLNTSVALGSLLNAPISEARASCLLGKQLHFALLQRILQQMVSVISLSICPLGANNASCFAQRLISFALNVESDTSPPCASENSNSCRIYLDGPDSQCST